MVQGYYTLEEAARILGMAPDQLSQMAQRREVRAFADRGTWRFRTQDIEELGRQKGLASDPELQLGEAPRPKAPDSPAPKSRRDLASVPDMELGETPPKAPDSPAPKSPRGLASVPDMELGETPRPKAHDSPVPKSPAESSDHGVFKFSLGGDSDQVEIGQEVFHEPSGGGPRSGGPKSGGPKSGGPKSPPPKPSSDSDVRLVPEGSDIGFQIGSDSDVKVVDAPMPTAKGTPAKPGGGPKPDSDSDVKIVPESTDEHTVQLGRQAAKSGTDSDIRLEQGEVPAGKRGDDSMLTEEIDLDAELRTAEEASRVKKSAAKSKVKPGADQPLPPATSPFELSGTEMETAKKEKTPDSSSDFELKPLQDDTSPIELGSDEMKALRQDEEVALGEPATGPGSDSGINLQDPADSGISLEQKPEGSDEIEFELSLDAQSTPRPAPAAQGDSDSEFELTLDDSGRLAPLEEEAAAAKAKKPEAKDEDKDIFETDFEVPALDESGSQAVALDESDTDLESSDFDLALGEEDIATEEESGSQVVVLEDEEADEGAATVARKGPRRGAALADMDEGADLEEMLGEEGELEEAGPPVRAPAAPAVEEDWGLLPVFTMGFTALLMFVVGLMSYELVHGMWGYRQPYKVSGAVVKSVSGIFGAELPKD